MALTFRSGKGSALTHTELDNNFRHFTGSHSITGSLIVSGTIAEKPNLHVLGQLAVGASAPYVFEASNPSGSITISGSLNISGSLVVSGSGNALTTSGSQSITGSLDITGSLNVSGSTINNTGPFNQTGTSALSGSISSSGLPTTEPITTGSLWISGSSVAHPSSSYLMIFNP